MLYIVLAYLMLFAALTNSVCLNNASFFFLFKYFLCQGYELSGEIALKNNHYYYYYVTDMLHKKPLHTRNTRSSSYTMPLLNRPAHSKATLGDRSFSFASSSVWNSIPNDVRCAPSLSSFKSRLKTYLFRSVYKDWTVSLITVHMCMVWPRYGFVDGLS